MGKSQSKLTPKQLAELQSSTHFNQDELKIWYKNYMRDYPDGRLSKEEFRNFHQRVFPSGDPTQFAEYFFDVFDTDDNDEIDFREFICPLSLTARGNPDEKLKWVFQMYDINHDGSIAHDEMLKIVGSVYKMVGPTVELPVDEKTPEQRVDKIFTSMDTDNNARVTYEEFVEGIKRDPAISKALALYDGFA